MVTVAPATTPPEGSVTVPAMFAAFPVCEKPLGAAANVTKSKNKAARNALAKLMNESPFMNGSVCAAQRPPRMK
jgi:hypothetical protein